MPDPFSFAQIVAHAIAFFTGRRHKVMLLQDGEDRKVICARCGVYATITKERGAVIHPDAEMPCV